MSQQSVGLSLLRLEDLTKVWNPKTSPDALPLPRTALKIKLLQISQFQFQSVVFAACSIEATGFVHRLTEALITYISNVLQ